MIHDDITNDLDIDPEVVVNQDVAKPSNLWPRHLGVRLNHVSRKVVSCLANDLEVTFDRVLCHLDKICATGPILDQGEVPLAPGNSLKNV